MNKCILCGTNIGHHNGNRKYCNRCKHTPKVKPIENVVIIPIEEYQKLIRDSKLLKKIKEML